MSRSWLGLLKEQIGSLWWEISRGWNRTLWRLVLIGTFLVGLAVGLNIDGG